MWLHHFGPRRGRTHTLYFGSPCESLLKREKFPSRQDVSATRSMSNRQPSNESRSLLRFRLKAFRWKIFNTFLRFSSWSTSSTHLFSSVLWFSSTVLSPCRRRSPDTFRAVYSPTNWLSGRIVRVLSDCLQWLLNASVLSPLKKVKKVLSNFVTLNVILNFWIRSEKLSNFLEVFSRVFSKVFRSSRKLSKAFEKVFEISTKTFRSF